MKNLQILDMICGWVGPALKFNVSVKSFIAPKLMGILILVTGLSLPSLPAAFAEDVDVTFLLISDIYEMSDPKAKRGGFARVNAVAKSERAKGGNLIYAHAGDFISPSLLSGFDKGEHVIELTNLVPPDIVVPGNHEFDFGKEIFLKRIGELNSTILSANLRQVNGSKVPGIEDTKIIVFGDASDPMKSVRIGIVGLTLEDTPDVSSPGDLKFADIEETAMTSAKALRKQGADILVAILHGDFVTDHALYRSGAFDFVLSGHDHDLALLYNGKTLMAESKSEGDLIVAVDVKFSISKSRNKRRVDWWPNFRIIDSRAIKPDTETLVKVIGFQKTLSAELDVSLGDTKTELDSRKSSVRTEETAIGNLISDAIKTLLGADVAITNGGGIRGNKIYDAGSKLTRRDILTELPFGNKTLLLEVSGETIKAALEHGVSRVEKSSGRFLHVSGMTFSYDKNKPAGERIVEILVNGVALDMAKIYKLAANSYIAGGGNGYIMLRKSKVLIGDLAAKLQANNVMLYIRKQGSISPKIEGRIKLVRANN